MTSDKLGLTTPSAPPHSPPCPICGESFASLEGKAWCVDGFQLVHDGKCIREYRRRKASVP